MRVGEGRFQYDWLEDFAEIPEPEAAARGWAHPGMTLTRQGTIVTVHPGLPRALELSPDGALLRSWDLPVTEIHGITSAGGDEQPCFWIADIGRKRDPDTRYEGNLPGYGHALKTDLEGRPITEMTAPSLAVYEEGAFTPTQVAIHEPERGGNGDIWITDGYGESQIHRFSAAGEYILTIDGENGAGAFNTPHAIHIDTRGPDPELYVADRLNGRVQVYDLDGAFKRSFGEDFFITPSAFAPLGDHLVVAELNARVAIIDPDDNLVLHLGDNHAVGDEPGWPNMLDADGHSVRTDRLEAGLFNSPYGLATDEDGNIYVAEWLIGGRFIKLAAV